MKTSTLLSIVSILALSAGTSIAADNYLVGTGWGGGGMAGNWSTGASPTISDDIFIDYKYYFEAKAPRRYRKLGSKRLRLRGIRKFKSQLDDDSKFVQSRYADVGNAENASVVNGDRLFRH